MNPRNGIHGRTRRQARCSRADGTTRANSLGAFLRIPRPLYDIVFGREWFRDPAHVGPVSHDIFAGLTEHEDRAE